MIKFVRAWTIFIETYITSFVKRYLTLEQNYLTRWFISSSSGFLSGLNMNKKDPSTFDYVTRAVFIASVLDLTLCETFSGR